MNRVCVQQSTSVLFSVASFFVATCGGCNIETASCSVLFFYNIYICIFLVSAGKLTDSPTQVALPAWMHYFYRDTSLGFYSCGKQTSMKKKNNLEIKSEQDLVEEFVILINFEVLF